MIGRPPDLTAKGDVVVRQGQARDGDDDVDAGWVGRGRIEMRSVGGVVLRADPGRDAAGQVHRRIDPDDKRSPLARSFAGTTDQMNPMRSLKRRRVVGAQRRPRGPADHARRGRSSTTRSPWTRPGSSRSSGRLAARRAQMPEERRPTTCGSTAKHQLHRMTMVKLSGLSFEGGHVETGESPSDVKRPAADAIASSCPAHAADAERQRPRMLPRIPFIDVGTGPLGIGMFERLASSALIRRARRSSGRLELALAELGDVAGQLGQGHLARLVPDDHLVDRGLAGDPLVLAALGVSSGRSRLGLPSPIRTMPGGPTTR